MACSLSRFGRRCHLGPVTALFAELILHHQRVDACVPSHALQPAVRARADMMVGCTTTSYFVCASACRFIGRSEPAIVVALYFHLSTAIMSAGPLAFGWPQALKPLLWVDALLLVGVAAGSFLGQLFMTRGLQLENASLISSLNFSQV